MENIYLVVQGTVRYRMHAPIKAVEEEKCSGKYCCAHETYGHNKCMCLKDMIVINQKELHARDG